MFSTPDIILRVAVPSPICACFDYLPLAGTHQEKLQPGLRLKIPFGRRTLIGVLISIESSSTVPRHKLKPILRLIDEAPLFDAGFLALCQWASEYYHYSLGEILHNALPPPLRCDIPAEKPGEENSPATTVKAHTALALNTHQKEAVTTLQSHLNVYQAFLLDGITGSGKTEVYLQILECVLKAGKQALILVPEISLTPQTIARFSERFHVNIVSLHSGLNPRRRMEAWLAAKYGTARIIIGTRSAIFTPFAALGMIIIDEEHDVSFKQQDNLRYSARDVAVKRAHLNNIPIILGSATPSLESVYNVAKGRYLPLHLPVRAGDAHSPDFSLLNIRGQTVEEGLSSTLLNRMRQHLEQGNQVLLFLNRRGYAPVLICHECGWIGKCTECDARYTLHWKAQRLRCHHCEKEVPLFRTCPECNSMDLVLLGQGTERIEQILERHFQNYTTVRIDRDNTRKKGAFQALFHAIHEGKAQILIGTQMLAKGHHFPGVTLVAVLDADVGLFSLDFRASERMGQLLLQVAGRAGRGDKKGEVVIQTRHPDHPLLQQLLSQNYQHFADMALAERKSMELPPYGYIALIRAEAIDASKAQMFLNDVREMACECAMIDVTLLGPVPAPMEKRAGRYRAQLLLKAKQRHALQYLLKTLMAKLNTAKIPRSIRWSLDVDPQEMF